VVYEALGAGDFAIVDVSDYSPAWHGGIRNGAWILSIDGTSLQSWPGAPVGAVVNIKAFRAIGGHLETDLTLAEAPKQRRRPPALRRRPQYCESGRVALRFDRPRWETILAESGVNSSALRVGMLLSNTACGDAGWTANWPYARIATRLRISRATVCRALRQLREAGFISVETGQRARRNNKLTMTFPSMQSDTVVIPFPEQRCAAVGHRGGR
jgi:hypothetical protein